MLQSRSRPFFAGAVPLGAAPATALDLAVPKKKKKIKVVWPVNHITGLAAKFFFSFMMSYF